jgi:hypothetical protein
MLFAKRGEWAEHGTLGLYVLWPVSCITSFLLIGFFAKIDRRVWLTRAESSSEGAQLRYLSGLLGDGSFTFTASGLELTGRMPSRRWPVFLVTCAAGIVAYVASAQLDAGRTGISVVGFLYVLYLFQIQDRLRRGTAVTCTVVGSVVASVTCRGPLVTLRFRPALAGRLKQIKVWVHPSARLVFFKHLEEMLPGRLPATYREALKPVSP